MINTKKPAGLAPCGLSGLHQSTLVIDDGEFWWSWRELNPHLFSFNLLIYMFIIYFEYAACTSRVFFMEFLDLLILG